MNIVVLVKQVPDTTEMNVDKETGTLIRSGVPSIINPDDLAGIEEALKIKDQTGAKITAITMGPKQAEGMLRELLARGVDDVILVTDRNFAGSDTWATSNTLAAALKTLEYDLIFAGRQAIDGDTAQVGPQTAEKLTIPQVTYVSEILSVSDNQIVVKKSLETSYEIIEVTLPCLLTTLEGMNSPRYMSCRGIWRSFDKNIKELCFEDLEIEANQTGLKSSPTKVKRTFTKEVSGETETFSVSSDEAVKLITKTLKEKQIIA
ncbi:electron transfer flavoprotein subunit beta/FixA family protein [Haloplasma contractile]|uniref:Electron transfer flavoprotein small subunit n=1 Tax=Haloplasma contractile SSD-17B TaxID=1033810 RepID=U2E6L7_9MOLU|nr:electron transfer flavoprotein subunit beta/FixA family protein [Haloplasma contractile]ERJ10873.1 Electron transfer flavoprotein beta-subunit [Haloplasma contractile SSD-17B]